MTTDVAALKAATKSVLHDVAKHARALAHGLQSVAPPQEGIQNKSVLYLTEVAVQLDQLSQAVDRIELQ